MLQGSARFSKDPIARRAITTAVTPGVIIAIVGALIAGALGVALPGCSERSVPPPEGYLLDDLALPLLDGRPFDPTPFRGKNILVNFWRPG